jgi:hypothetical protein
MQNDKARKDNETNVSKYGKTKVGLVDRLSYDIMKGAASVDLKLKKV